MPCVRKRRGKWVIDFYDQFGKRHWETVGTNKKRAEEVLATRLLDVGKNVYCPENKTKTFGEVAEEWFKTQIAPNKRPKTSNFYRKPSGQPFTTLFHQSQALKDRRWHHRALHGTQT